MNIGQLLLQDLQFYVNSKSLIIEIMKTEHYLGCMCLQAGSRSD